MHSASRNEASFSKAIVSLPTGEEASASTRLSEAERIAATSFSTFADLKRRYRMVRPASLHNILINVGLKKEGLCWHWTRDLKERLEVLHLKEYDLLWATAREGSFREHNSLVIVSRGRPLEEGLLLDGWRYSGRPFWIPVAGDRYPWKEAR